MKLHMYPIAYIYILCLYGRAGYLILYLYLSTGLVRLKKLAHNTYQTALFPFGFNVLLAFDIMLHFHIIAISNFPSYLYKIVFPLYVKYAYL